MRKLLVAAAVLLALPAFGGGVMPFIENDFAGAVARAKAARLPIFVEAWAPW
jgi:hypothetical protein